MLGYLATNHALIAAFAPRPVGRTRRETLSLNRVFRQAPKLADYFEDFEIPELKGSLDRPISGVAFDSRRVAPGNIFFAVSGLRREGSNSIDEAVSRGAVAVVADTMPAFAPAKVTFVRVADVRLALARFAQRYFRFPDRDLAVVGVAGTGGKTTVAHLLKYFLNGDQRVGLVGTIAYDLGARVVPAFRTTPESLDVFGMMAQMRDAGCRQAVLEVTSGGIAQKRVHGIQFAAAVFNGLSSASSETDFEITARLFTGESGPLPRAAVVNLDDPSGARLLALLPSGVRPVTFGENASAQVRAESIAFNPRGTAFKLVWPGGEMAIESPLIGRYNLGNLLAAVAAAWSLCRDPVVFLAKLRAFKGVPGRMERIDAGQPFEVFVDYARTPESLGRSLGMVRAFTPGRLVVVFGCVGERHRPSRAPMVRAVQAAADFAVATAVNPGHEPVETIFDDMRAGVVASGQIAWVNDRRAALALALESCRPGDTLVVAGKGHESYQQLADTVVPFDDREVVRELIGRAPESC